jgi:CBS domain-containing protein
MTTELLRDYRVKNFMSRNVATVSRDTSLGEAVGQMVTREVGSLVVTKEGVPIGILTERDLVSAMANGPDPKGRRVDELMDAVITKVSPSLTPQEAARVMTDTKGRILAFEDGRLAGLVTSTDVVKVVWRLGSVFEIEQVLSKKVVTTETWMPIIAVLKMMNEHRVGSVILTEDRIPRAIFTERDLLNRVLYAHLGLDQPAVKAASRPLISAELGINGGEAAHAMVARKIKRLPLMSGGRLAAIVTARDVVEGYAYQVESKKTDLEMQMAVKYGELCPLCNTRIDDRGLCGCGTMGGD